MRKKATTIIDVARATGVSPSTVSHAISGKRAISPPVKKKIFEKIQELDYRPAFYAQALKNSSTGLIGVVVSECRNPGAALFLDGLAAKLEEFSYKPVIGLTGMSHEKGEEMLRRFSSGLVDGVINLLPYITPDEAQELCGVVPVVTNIRESIIPVILDYSKLTLDILEHFWERGHRKIGYITSRTRFEREDPTPRLMQKFFEERNTPFHLEEQTFPGDDSIEGGIRGCEHLFRNGNCVSAVFCGNDMMAFGVYRWAYEHKVSIPHDLSVVGFDNVPQAATIVPPLTTASFPYAEIIDHTVRLLMAKLERRQVAPGKMILEMPLIARHSVATVTQPQKKEMIV